MIDIKDLRQNPDAYQDSATKRGIKVDIGKILKLDSERLKLLPEVESLRAKLNIKGKPDAAQLKQLQTTKKELATFEAKLEKVEAEQQELLWQVPNLMSGDTPEGGEESSRVEATWGKATKQPELKDHLELAVANGWLDFERGAKVAGNKFYFLKGSLFKLEMALKRLAIDIINDKDDVFTLMEVPHLVNGRVAAGTGFLPRGEERQIYKVEDEDLNLIATAELPLTGYHADEVLDPQGASYAGWSPSYRLEAGAYGKHSKGLYRVHQFNKLEMYSFTQPQHSDSRLDWILDRQTNVARALEIPYRVTRTASGDLSAPAYKKYDVEYWSPVEGEYRELMSCSNCTDFQARRLNIKIRTDQGETVFAHTLNGTALAISRAIIAILENHQTTDGRVKIPKKLRKYYGGKFL